MQNRLTDQGNSSWVGVDEHKKGGGGSSPVSPPLPTPLKWSFKLAPQLIGKAQQAYAALTTEEAADYEKFKKAILIRYDINEESYRKQFRTAKKADSETNRELKARLDNLAAKWLNECATAADVRDKVVMEQLIDTLPLAV